MFNKPHSRKLNEGLRPGDLNHFVDNLFTVDQFKSKMGLDEDVIVLAFRVKDKGPATDLMEFIEKGYPDVLDADISAGEERDGQYSVFVEMERNRNAPRIIGEILHDISKLCDVTKWRFRYYKEYTAQDFSEELAKEHIPLSKDDYHARLLKIKNGDLKRFFNQGAINDVNVDEDDNMTIEKPYAESLTLKFVDTGDYQTLKESLVGGIQLDSASMGQTLYIQKYLGNYEVTKIANQFLIKNGDKAVIVDAPKW